MRMDSVGHYYGHIHLYLVGACAGGGAAVNTGMYIGLGWIIAAIMVVLMWRGLPRD